MWLLQGPWTDGIWLGWLGCWGIGWGSPVSPSAPSSPGAAAAAKAAAAAATLPGARLAGRMCKSRPWGGKYNRKRRIHVRNTMLLIVVHLQSVSPPLLSARMHLHNSCSHMVQTKSLSPAVSPPQPTW